MITSDLHSHLTLSKKDIPKYLFGKFQPLIAKTNKRAKFAAKFLHLLIPFSNKDGLDRLANILEMSIIPAEEKIKKHLEKYDKIVLIATDLHGCNAGFCIRSYEEQINEILYFKNKYPGRIYMALMIDPNRENIHDIINKYAIFADFFKYYPTISGQIDNLIVNRVCQIYKKPWIVHCSSKSIIYNHEYDKKIVDLFCNPKFTEQVALKNPSIKFILAHFGSTEYFDNVKKLIIEKDNIFADISFCYPNMKEKIDKVIEKYPTKVIMGSDSFLQNDEYKDFYNVNQLYMNNLKMLNHL